MTEAVVFDMDGVLVDSEPLHFATTNEVLGRRGVTLDAATYTRCTGMAEEPFFEFLVQRFGLSEPPAALARERVALSLGRLLHEPLPPREGALECLLRLRGEGFRLALASSATAAQVELVVARLGLGRVLEAIVSAEDVAHAKPAPDLFVEAAARLAVPPAACVVVEDAVLGVQAAVAAGMVALALVPPPATGEAHLAAGAAAVLSSLDQLTADALETWTTR